MILVIDVGNSQMTAGLFENQKPAQEGIKTPLLTFRHATTVHTSSDELGLFMRNALRENGQAPEAITGIAVCSVVPHLMYALRAACVKYFDLEPFILGPGSKTGLKIQVPDPSQVGADRIASAIGAVQRFPKQNIILVDLGTANTVCAVSKEAGFLGGTITPGLRMSLEALERGTAKLPLVALVKPEGPIVGRTTEAAIQNGLYYNALDSLKGMIARTQMECFGDEGAVVVGTGGFMRLFEEDGLCQHICSHLVLEGTLTAFWKSTR